MTGVFGPFWAGVWDGACAVIIIAGLTWGYLRRQRNRP